jgi:hypothetical protein
MSKHPHEFIFPQYVPNEMKRLFVWYTTQL